MPLFGNGSGGGFFNELKATLGFTPREDYDDEYDVYSDNFDDYSTYEDDGAYYDEYDRGGDRSYEGDYLEDGYYDDGYSDSHGEAFERGSAGGYGYAQDRRMYGSLSLPNIYDVRRGVQRSQQDRIENLNRRSFRSDDYLTSGSAERDAAVEASRMPRRPEYADRGGANRGITVVSPMSYDDVERVANVLKSGDSVVLDFTRTRSDTLKRVLDFSCGAASIAGAKVECIADRVFAIAIGGPITEGERVRLRSQGVRL